MSTGAKQLACMTPPTAMFIFESLQHPSLRVQWVLFLADRMDTNTHSYHGHVFVIEVVAM